MKVDHTIGPVQTTLGTEKTDHLFTEQRRKMEYPKKTCEIDRLVTHKKLIEAALAGKKTQQRRNGVYAYPGEEFELEGVTFKLTDLRREKLGELDDVGAQAEGFPDLKMYRHLIEHVHKDEIWDDERLVWVHEFEKAAT